MIKRIFQKIDDVCGRYEVLYWIRLAILCAMVVCSVMFVLSLIPKKEPLVDKPLVHKPSDNYRDRYNNLRSEIQVLQLEKRDFKKATDSLKKVLKGRPKIKEVTVYTSVIDTHFADVPVKMQGDSIFSIAKQDNYIFVSAQGNVNTGVGEINFYSIDSITYINYEKKRFLKANEHVINISNKNPYNTIVSGAAIQYKEPKVILVVGPQGGYNPFNNSFYGGFGVTMNLFSIKSKR